MPLKRGSSQANIGEMLHAGRPREQAIAAALDTATIGAEAVTDVVDALSAGTG